MKNDELILAYPMIYDGRQKQEAMIHIWELKATVCYSGKGALF